MLLSSLFTSSLGSKKPFLCRDTPFKSHVVAVIYSLHRVFPCTQAFKSIIIDHLRKQYEPGAFQSCGLESRVAVVLIHMARNRGQSACYMWPAMGGSDQPIGCLQVRCGRLSTLAISNNNSKSLPGTLSLGRGTGCRGHPVTRSLSSLPASGKDSNQASTLS